MASRVYLQTDVVLLIVKNELTISAATILLGQLYAERVNFLASL